MLHVTVEGNRKMWIEIYKTWKERDKNVDRNIQNVERKRQKCG